MEHGEDWTTWVAYIAIVALVAAWIPCNAQFQPHHAASFGFSGPYQFCSTLRLGSGRVGMGRDPRGPLNPTNQHQAKQCDIGQKDRG
jgi:hypothetical protein